jgi:hypothetical protein
VRRACSTRCAYATLLHGAHVTRGCFGRRCVCARLRELHGMGFRDCVCVWPWGRGSGVLLRDYGGWTRYRLWERHDDLISTSQYVVMLGFGVTSHFFGREVVLEMGARGDEFNDKQIRLPDPSQNRSNHSTFKFLTKPYTFTMLQSITQATMHRPISHTTPFFYPTNTLLPTIYTTTNQITTIMYISTPLA